ncbi:hypothetical protein [Kibdelosporangium phytohabitans]|uniref:Uncharacterized protein n=1 Tax=Kibdelosporangium phytohabitans TaxID=860235 RepID=A0A0N7F5I4_9PSEU|nr:hypothetical protein [Kibdelosporangium phytohabitans]ALG14319.1 hypothetical protein AOZ06_52240 [Kibdelosporangium phytohabitans]MBE1466669.1 hypothetical protein [Kibdelosporangium phytohabitans]
MAGAVGAWFSEFAKAVAGELATAAVDGAKWVFTEAWKAWKAPSEELTRRQKGEGFGYYTLDVYGHMIPGTTLVGLARGKNLDPAVDRLGCARNTGELIILESWAWKAVQAFIRNELGDKKDDDRLHLLQLLVGTLMPHAPGTAGKSPKATTSWVNYRARDGDVEIVKFTDSGKPKVTVTASGYFTNAPGTPTKRTFDLA